jgi:hypothetical protein
MSFNSGNPLSYLGLPETDVPQITVSKRSPTTGDLNHKPGDMWVNTILHAVFVLSANHGGQAFWISVGGGVGSDLYITPYVVDIAGNAPYTSIQAAINDAGAAGGGTVAIRHGVYIENISMLPNVSLIGFSGSFLTGGTSLVGTVTVNITGSCFIQDISIGAAAGNSIVISGIAGSFVVFQNCFISSGSADLIVATNPSASIVFDNCLINQSAAFTNFTVTDSNINFFYSNIIRDGSPAVNSIIQGNGRAMFSHCTTNPGVSASGSSRCDFDFCTINTAVGPSLILSNTAQSRISFCKISTNDVVTEAITVGIGTDSTLRQCSIISSGLFSIAGKGTLNYDVLTFNGFGSTTLDPSLTINLLGTKPLSTASNSAGAQRGVSGYDSNEFTVDASGFVNLGSGPQTTTTIGAVTNTLITIPIPDNSTIEIIVRFSGFESTGPNGFGGYLQGVVRKGAPTTGFVIGSNVASFYSDVPLATANGTLTIDGSGDNALFSAVGVGGFTIDWTASATKVIAS